MTQALCKHLHPTLAWVLGWMGGWMDGCVYTHNTPFKTCGVAPFVHGITQISPCSLSHPEQWREG